MIDNETRHDGGNIAELRTYVVTIIGDDHEALYEVEVDAENAETAETNALDAFISNLEARVEEVVA